MCGSRSGWLRLPSARMLSITRFVFCWRATETRLRSETSRTFVQWVDTSTLLCRPPLSSPAISYSSTKRTHEAAAFFDIIAEQKAHYHSQARRCGITAFASRDESPIITTDLSRNEITHHHYHYHRYPIVTRAPLTRSLARNPAVPGFYIMPLSSFRRSHRCPLPAFHHRDDLLRRRRVGRGFVYDGAHSQLWRSLSLFLWAAFGGWAGGSGRRPRASHEARARARHWEGSLVSVLRIVVISTSCSKGYLSFTTVDVIYIHSS